MIRGNYIGTDAGGVLDRGNGTGIFLADPGSSSTVGGTSPTDRNVISGNGPSNTSVCDPQDVGAGIQMQSVGNRIQGNFIGTTGDGTAGLGNSVRGISSAGAVSNSGGHNLIGGSAAGAGNLVSGNGGYGIYAASPGDRILGNRIGTDPSGAYGIPNAAHGIYAVNLGLVIGGAAPNTIAFNGANGIRVNGPSGQAAAIRGNSIFSNGSIGIDLGGNGVTANDANDVDSGPNFLQNYPVITSAVRNGSTFDIAGTFNSISQKTHLLEFFSNANCDPSGYGEGQHYLGAVLVTTDGAGNASFAASFPAVFPGDRWFTATAVASLGGATSEFSQCKQRPNTADLAIDKTASADRVGVGETFTYHLNVTLPRGSETATGIGIDDRVPPTLVIQSVQPSRGSCTVDAQDVHCDLGNSSRFAATVDIVVQTTEPGTFINTAFVTSTSFDPNTTNNQSSVETTVG